MEIRIETFSEDTQAHDVRGIPIRMEFQKLIANIDSVFLWDHIQSLFIARPELVIGMIGIRSGFVQLIESPNVAANIFVMFRINCLQLSIGTTDREQRRDEKLGESENNSCFRLKLFFESIFTKWYLTYPKQTINDRELYRSSTWCGPMQCKHWKYHRVRTEIYYMNFPEK